MPYYEVTVTCSKPVCVKADSEGEANDAACEQFAGDWNRVEAETEGELDEVAEAGIINEYRQQGELFEA